MPVGPPLVHDPKNQGKGLGCVTQPRKSSGPLLQKAKGRVAMARTTRAKKSKVTKSTIARMMRSPKKQTISEQSKQSKSVGELSKVGSKEELSEVGESEEAELLKWVTKLDGDINTTAADKLAPVVGCDAAIEPTVDSAGIGH